MPKKADQTGERFAVSHQGMKALHASRPPWELIKELIQNSWDEAPEATVCTVTVRPQVLTGRTTITVEDDGPGFADVRDAYTLMGDTPKRADPRKRGRFNLGEKEFLSVAVSAEIQTKGQTVTFPESGGREIKTNRRRRGTLITADMPWNEEQAIELTERLWIFRPSECRLVVNESEIPIREPLATHRAILETVLQESHAAPMRRTRRNTDIQILSRLSPGTGWIYEMGIPIQPIETPFDLDIQQKVPMPPNRTEVPTRYLSILYGETLNAMHSLMDPDSFGDSWVKQALQEDRTAPEAIQATVSARYGDKVLFISNDADANLEAAERGYELINRTSISQKERQRFRDHGGVRTTREVFPTPDLRNPVHLPEDDEKTAFTAWIQQLGRAAGLDVTVQYIDNPKFPLLADCTIDTPKPVIRINAAHIPDGFLQPPYNRPEQLELVIHEFGHAIAGKGLKHGSAWGNGVAKAAGLVSSHLASHPPAPLPS